MSQHTLPTINDIRVSETVGAWPTKSGGTLEVLWKFDWEMVWSLVDHDSDELGQIDTDIRGLRQYTVHDIPRGKIGANEWHKVRTEVVTATSGKLEWSCTDHFGQTKSIIITPGIAVVTPHHILHRYRTLADNTTIVVCANTLFFPDSPQTHDTYPAGTFTKILSDK